MRAVEHRRRDWHAGLELVGKPFLVTVFAIGGGGWVTIGLGLDGITIDAHELRRRVTAMSTLFYVAPILRLDHIRHGLTLEELAGSLADLVVDGICRRKE